MIPISSIQKINENDSERNQTYLSMQIFSTWGTKTWSNRIIVCNGNLALHDATHSGVGVQIDAALTEFDVTRMLPRY